MGDEAILVWVDDEQLSMLLVGNVALRSAPISDATGCDRRMEALVHAGHARMDAR